MVPEVDTDADGTIARVTEKCPAQLKGEGLHQLTPEIVALGGASNAARPITR